MTGVVVVTDVVVGLTVVDEVVEVVGGLDVVLVVEAAPGKHW